MVLKFIEKLLTIFLPREERFFDIFIEMLEINRNSIALINAVRSDNVRKVEKEISSLEDRSDILEYTVQQRLKASITTPSQLSRDSILTISSTIDNMVDSTKSLAKRFESGEGEIITLINENYQEFWKMLDLLHEGVEISLEIMKSFSENKLDADDPRLKRIHDIENEIDQLHIHYITEKLYHSQFTGKEMVIMQLIGRIEGTADELQRLGKIIQGILVSG